MFETTMTDAEVLLKAADAMTKLKPLLEAKNIADCIKGFDKVKEIAATKDEVVATLEKAEKLNEVNTFDAAKLKEGWAKLAVAQDKVTAESNSVNDKAKAVEDREVLVGKKEQVNNALESELKARKAAIEAKEATIQADLEAAADAKKKAQDRLVALNNISTEV